MTVSRKSFIQKALLGTALISTMSPISLLAQKRKKSKAQLNLSFNEGVPPGKTLEEKLDFMEENGVVGLEPGGGNLASRVEGYKKALNGRNIKISAICAGFEGFLLAEDTAVRAKFDETYRSILAAAGELGSIGVVMVPAFNRQLPVKPHTLETRSFLVDELGKLGEYALSCGTTVILEPLNRGEAYYLRQVADGASICRDINSAGVKCMGDFWHMTFEETNDYAAFLSAGEHLQHVHIASRGHRVLPAEDGELDNYLEGFRALKEMDYNKYVSFECGCRSENRAEAVKNALSLLRTQWKKA